MTIPLPTAPPPPQPPKGSWLSIGLAFFAALAACIALSFLTLGVFASFLLVAAGMLLIAGLQYLLFGAVLRRLANTPDESDDDTSA